MKIIFSTLYKTPFNSKCMLGEFFHAFGVCCLNFKLFLLKFFMEHNECQTV